MNPPTWTDDELLRQLSAALREPEVDEGFIRVARAAFTSRTVGADPGRSRPGPAEPAWQGSPARPGEYVN
jgi:hypothetical protein